MEATQPLNPLDAIVEIPLDAAEFKANGVSYFVIRNPKRLTIDRYIEFERKSIELGFSGDFAFILRKLVFATKHCTPTDYNVAYATIINLIHGMTDDETKLPMCVLFCTIFIIRQDEDVKSFSASIAKQKIADWRAEGIAIGFFLTFANDMLGNYNEIYQAISQTFSAIPPDPIARTERIASLKASDNPSLSNDD